MMPLTDYLIDPALPDAYDRSLVDAARERVLFRERHFAQAADLNEAFSLARMQRARIGGMVARDGDRIDGAAALVDIDAATVTLSTGKIYVRGDVRPVGETVLEDVPMAGDIAIGVRLSVAIIDEEDDPSLLGLHPGTMAEGEPGSAREIVALSWGHSADAQPGLLYQVYLLRNGHIVDQTPPPGLSVIQDVISRYDYDAHENYVVRGCTVIALGEDDGKQWFSIGEGVANILGRKRTRDVATRYGETESPDLLAINSEPQTFNFDGGGTTAVLRLNRAPINSVSQVIVTRQVTETVVRGGVANTSDLLGHPSVTAIIEIVQGATTYVAGTDYAQQGDRVNWSAAGAEPAPASSYNVTYRYLEAVAPGDITLSPDRRSIEVLGGATVVANSQTLVSYSYRLPRHDRICLDESGAVVYLKGLAAVENAQPPQTPTTLLSLAIVKNDWFGTPAIDASDTTRSVPFWLQWRYFRRLVDMVDMVALNRLQLDIAAREPVAKRGVFVDPFDNDRYRDEGEPQNGAVFGGQFRIPIDPTYAEINLSAPQCLNYTEETVIAQEFITGCTKINPYMSFAPLPAKMTLTPAQDFWVESREVWLSPVTEVFGTGNAQRVVDSRVRETTDSSAARFLRQISVAFEIEGFGAGENLVSLTFDGINVTPAGPPVADANGRIVGAFTIPSNVAAGVKSTQAVGSVSSASARFIGEGRIDTTIRQQITRIQRETLNVDPVAQSFRLPGGRHVSSVEVKFCAIGDVSEPVICEIVTMDNGYPTTEVIAQTETDMHGAIVGTWHRFVFDPPVFIADGQDAAVTLKTNDPDHSVSFAARGGFDAGRQQYVGAQPYTVGVRFSSSNAETWTAHQDEDLTIRINCAVFAPETKTVALGMVPAAAMSDFLVQCAAFLPTAQTRIQFEVEPIGESAIRLEPGQVWERQSYFTGQVKLTALLTGARNVSPILGRDLLAIKGSMQANGVYVSRAMEMGTNVDVRALMKTRLPAGSTLTVENDGADDDWQELTPGPADLLADGSYERSYSDPNFTAPRGRIRLTLTGTPAARPSVSDFRAWSI